MSFRWTEWLSSRWTELFSSTRRRRVVRAGSLRSRRACLRVERLEDRLLLSHLGDDALFQTQFSSADFASVESYPPGENGGPTPTRTPAYTTLANGIPELNSNPGAATAIYIDFDGDTTTATTAYTEDGDGTTFNTTEQLHIYEAWREMSSYYGFFDANVTTVQPAASMPKAWLAVGNNISGGYSYVGVFPNTKPESFNQSSDARTRVSGLAHEIGHNYGLWHQSTYDQWGTKTAEYASSTDALHGPMMGVDYSGTIHKFFIGHDSTASGVSSLQDDIAIIASKIKPYQPAGGDGFLADDFGNTIVTATPLPVNGAAQWTPAIIERLGDVDAFSFTSTGGVYALSAAPDAPSGVDLKLDVYAADGTLLAASDGANNVQELTMSLAAGTYYALVSSHANYGDVGTYFVSASALPAGWASVDVGTGVSGYTIYDGGTGTFNVVGTGAGVTSTADNMQYAYETLNGDGTIVARIANVDNTSASARVGVSIRESVASNSRHVSMTMAYSNGAQLLSRATTGGTTTTVSGTAGTFTPTWVKLVRVGSTFTGYTSPNGVSWTQLGTATTVSMANSVTVGLLTSSNNVVALNVGVLDNVTVTGSVGTPGPTYNGLSAPTGLTVSLPLGADTGLNLAWNAVASSTGYAVDRSSDGVNYTQIATTGSGVTTYSNTGLAGSMRYFYRVSALDADGRSVSSQVESAINRPSAVTSFSITSATTTQVILNWRDTSGETGYRIERSTDGTNYSTLATVASNVPSYTNSGLTSGAAYYYRVIPTSTLGDGPTASVTGAPRLPAVNPTLGTIVVGSIGVQWTDIAGETGYRIERSTNGTTFTTLTNVGANVTSYADTSVASAGEYYYRIFGTTSLTQSLTGTVKFAAAPSASPPAAPWTSQDIGTANGPGTTDLTSGTFKIVSSGGDVGGTSDAFRFTSQPLSADGEIVARVTTVENSGTSAKVGVMIRQSSAANSANAFVYVTPSVIGFQYRATAGGSTTQVASVTGTVPQWVRLVRTGNSFNASYSSDGINWTTLGTSATITMTGTASIGLAADANSSTLLNTSTLDNVAVQVSKSLSINDVSLAEGNSGTTTALFTVTLSSASSQTITVNYATADGTATFGSDYVATSGTLTFTPGQTTQTINVTINGDTIGELNESFFVNLSGATNASIADAQGTGTLQNDDSPALSINDVSIVEGNNGKKQVKFTVSLPAPAASTVSVNYATADGTATTAGSDYKSASGTATIAAGQSSTTITVTIYPDRTAEANETFFVNLSNAVNATLVDSQGIGTIVNDDGVAQSRESSDDQTTLLLSTLSSEIDAVVANGSHLTVNSGQKNALFGQLESAKGSLASFHLTAAADQLGASINSLAALKKGRQPDPALADRFMEDIAAILPSCFD